MEIETKKTRAKQKYSREERRRRTRELALNLDEFILARKRLFLLASPGRGFEEWFTDNGLDYPTWEMAAAIYIKLGMMDGRAG